MQQARNTKITLTAFMHWSRSARSSVSARNHHQVASQKHVFIPWLQLARRKKKLDQTLNAFLSQRQKRHLEFAFVVWKSCHQRELQAQGFLVGHMLRRETDLMRICFEAWLKEAKDDQAAMHYGKVLQKRTWRRWYQYALQKREERKMDRDLADLAIQHWREKIW